MLKSVEFSVIKLSSTFIMNIPAHVPFWKGSDFVVIFSIIRLDDTHTKLETWFKTLFRSDFGLAFDQIE